ncbi:MAG: MFS transporter [Sneathiella sp.]|mgnify:FL=1|uniref:MFS transporter n=1 Tax=Sneathiella sp. TaxID=1964365 RepID=UPI000C5A027D|nr:MFS transporter [Sneathiella sp.]MAL77560.1 MFS transporter [Sneathiella sp.]
MSPVISSDFTMALRLVPFYIALFLIVGFQLPFWPVWLAHKGLRPEEIGIVLSAPIWAKIFVTPAMTAIADYVGRRRAPLVVMSALCLGLFQLYFLVGGFWQIFFLALTIGVFITSFTALGDNLVLTLGRTWKIDYPRIRLWGSIAFIAGSYLGGVVMTGRSPDFIPVLLAVAYLLLFLCCLMLPEIRVERSDKGRKGFRLLLGNRSFVVFLIASGLIQGSHAVLYSSGTLHWQQQGLSDQTIGFLWAEGVIVEVILFAFSRRAFAPFSPVQLLLLAGVAGTLRWLVMSFTPGVPVLLLIQTLHGVTFAAAHLGTMRMISETIPLEFSARAQGLYTAIALGLIMGGEMFLSGYLYDAFAAQAYFFMAGSCLIALCLCLRIKS